MASCYRGSGANAIEFITDFLEPGEQGKNYSTTIAVVAENGKPVSWTISKGFLPDGLKLNKSDSQEVVISGIPTQAGMFTFSVKADNGLSSAESEYTIVINEEVKIYHNVSFMVDDEEYLVKEVEHDKSVVRPSEKIVKEGYYLRGWTTDPSSNKLYNFGTKVTSNLVLYAVFEKNEYTSEDGDVIEVDPVTMISGEKLSLTNAIFCDVEKKPAQVKSKNSGIVKIVGDNAIAKNIGTVVVEAQIVSDDKSKQTILCEITVVAKPKFKITKTMTYVGQQFTAAEYLSSEEAANGIMLWETSKDTVVEVIDEKEGRFEVMGPGTAKITAYFGEKGTKGVIKITSSINVKLPSFSKKEYNMITGAKQTISMKDVNSASNPVWDISDEYIIELSGMSQKNGKSTGKVTLYAKEAGETELTVTIDGQDYQCSIKVAEPVLSKEDIELKVGKTKVLTVKNTKLKKKDIEWSSDDETVATVDSNGKVKAVGEGGTVINAVVGGVPLKCAVVVERK